MKGAKGKGPAKSNALKPVDNRKVGKKKAPAKEASKGKTMAANYPTKPKKPPSSFLVFMEEFRATFIKENPYVKSPAAVGKAGGRKWKSMNAAEKAPYEAKVSKRKTEYENALEAYNKKRERKADDVEEEDSDKSTSEVDKESVQSAGNFSLVSGSNAKTPPKKPTVGQKKPSEALVSSLSKKQKVSEALLDQSIEQLNDVTAVSGVNLREEEDQLFSGSKEGSQLSEDSKKAVQEEERPILQKTHMINCGGQSSDVERCSSQLLDDDGDVEHLDSNRERRELVENVSSMSDSVEKCASPQGDIICIQGYKVKRSNATILEAIFKKHGDIAANCIFKTLSARAYHLAVICEVVRQIQTQDLIEMGEDIESQVSDAEAANINVSWIRAHFEAIHKRKKTAENHSSLMTMKENMMLVIQAAEMDRAKRSLELSAADKRVRVLHFFQQDLNDNILKNKEKIDSLVKISLV